MTCWSWDRVEQRVSEVENIEALRATAVALRQALKRLTANPSLQGSPPYVVQGSLVFPGNFARSVVLRWNEEDGYQVSLARSNRPLSATRTVPVDDLAEVILAYLDRCRLPIPDATAAEMGFLGWSWERVESTLNEAEEIAPFRTTAAAMKRMLPRLKVELQAIPPYVSHVTLVFPCAFRNYVLLHWSEAQGYQVSFETRGTAPSERKVVSEDELAEEILSYLERCQPEPTPPSATPSPPPKTKQAKRRAPPKRPTPPSPPKTKRAKRRAPPKR